MTRIGAAVLAKRWRPSLGLSIPPPNRRDSLHQPAERGGSIRGTWRTHSARDRVLPREGPGKPEVGKNAEVTKEGDGRDRIAVQRDHHQPIGAHDRRTSVRQVHPERRLTVGPGRYKS